MRVMLVEDDHNVMMVTKHYIESFGHEVVTAPDGETAVELFDLICRRNAGVPPPV